MNLNRFVKAKGEVLTCPFCMFPLTFNDHQTYVTQGRLGYDCFHCTVPGARGLNDKPYSRYSISVMEDVPVTQNICYSQVIFTEAFAIHLKDNKWYHVYNNLLKEQTNIVVVEPARPEHFYEGETVAGLIHVTNPLWFPLIDTWDPTDQEATLSKIKTYILFS